MTKQMALEFISMQTVQSMKDIGEMTNSMEKVLRYGVTIANIKVNTKMV